MQASLVSLEIFVLPCLQHSTNHQSNGIDIALLGGNFPVPDFGA
jgi:hypothetical protein